VEKNVGQDRQAALEMVRISGQQGVPVITVDGQAVVGFDIPRLTQLLDKSGPKLGASVADAATQARKVPGIPSAGAYVGNVRPGSAAEQAGLRKGDVITALGGERIQDASHLHRLLREMPKGRDLSLSYVRDGRTNETHVRL
jgi:S1-C subfamily serine protease